MTEAFKVREELSKLPDTMGDIYEFVKIDLDEFIDFVETLTTLVSRDRGVVVLFLEHKRPDYNWYVTPNRIYYTSNLPYPADAYRVLTTPETRTFPKGYPFADSETKEITYPIGLKIYDTTKLYDNKFSETQKWVQKLENIIMNYEDSYISINNLRDIIRKVVGK